MSRDELGQLLRMADDAAGHGPGAGADLAARVRRVAGRRRRRARVTAAAIALMVAGVIGLHEIYHGAGTKRVEVIATRSDPAAAELAALRREIAARERLVTVLLTEEKVGRAEEEVAMQRSMPRDRGAAERAAAAVVWQAGRAGRAGLANEAAAAYADVVRFFPDTVSADEARRRLGSNRKDG